MEIVGIYLVNPFSSMMSPPPKNQRDDSLWFLMPAARGDLYHLYRDPMYAGFIKRHTKRIFTQLLLCLEFLSNHGIAHRDLKPENILLFWTDNTAEEPYTADRTLHIKMSDMGMAKPLDQSGRNSTNIMTPYYRAPEVAMGCQSYNTSIDIWSAGMILYYLITGSEPFELISGNYDRELLRKINEFLPLATYQYPDTPPLTPPLPNDIKRIPLSQRLRNYNQAYPQAWPVILNFLPDGQNVEAPVLEVEPTIALIDQMLTLNHKRPSAKELLSNPWFAQNVPLIEMTRTLVPSGYPEIPFSTVPGPLRDMISNVYVSAFNNHETCPWYGHRILFMAIDLSDRCLIDKGVPVHPAFPEAFQNDQETEIRAYLLAFSCLYLAIKYYMYQPIPITQILPQMYQLPMWLEYLRQSEAYLLESVFGFTLYRPNLYEVASRNDVMATMEMLRALLKHYPKYIGQTPRQIWNQIESGLPPLPNIQWKSPG
jgi:serine/threonine protein kinase